MRADIDTSILNRSAITNGEKLLYGVSGRSVWARRLRDLIELHTSDKGGTEELSEAEKSIIRRASVLTVELEYQESRFALLRETDRAPSTEDLDVYSRLSGQLRRLLETVGIPRRARDISKDTPAPCTGVLDGYLDQAESQP